MATFVPISQSPFGWQSVGSSPSTCPGDQSKLIYLIERQPSPPNKPADPTTLDKIKHIVGYILITLGAITLLSGVFAGAGHVLRLLASEPATVQMFFTSGIVTLVAGFHLAGDARATELSTNYLSVSI